MYYNGVMDNKTGVYKLPTQGTYKRKGYYAMQKETVTPKISNIVTSDIVTTEMVSPYQLGVLMKIRPQMVYNYIKSGRIAHRKNELGKLVITKAEANRFAAEYESNKVKRVLAAKTKVQAQLKGQAS